MATLKLLATAAKVSPAVRRWSASARWCAVSFGLRPNLTPFAKALATFPRTFADEFTLEFSDTRFLRVGRGSGLPLWGE